VGCSGTDNQSIVPEIQLTIKLNDRVAIVTGGANGLGRAHVAALALRGAKVVIADMGIAAEAVAEEIRSQGGAALGYRVDVTDAAAVDFVIADIMRAWGRVDILINNAGILRDKTFAKMALSDFRLLMDVHVMGAVHFTKAVWPHMIAQHYGRVVMTTSSAGLYGNFGQAGYAAAKAALVGLMNTLAIEGARYGIRVNCLAPTAATSMTTRIFPSDMLELLSPQAVSPALLALVAEQAPTRMILCAGAGSYEAAHVTLTRGIHIGMGHDAAEAVLARLSEIRALDGQTVPENALVQARHEVENARHASQHE
jgi:NAD(P)-dependent dehydrogenase (short-subunit alcohol dehydrogenase family)